MLIEGGQYIHGDKATITTSNTPDFLCSGAWGNILNEGEVHVSLQVMFLCCSKIPTALAFASISFLQIIRAW